MPFSNNVVHLFSVSLFLFTALLPVSGEAADNQFQNKKELVWSQSDGLRFEIFFSSWQDQTWSPPVKITDNNANNLHPALDIAPDGTKWLFWSAVRPDGISIEYAIGQSQEWSEPVKMVFEQNSAITPSALVDKEGIVWLVWAGNNGGNDEIYYSQYNGQTWEKPQVVNKPNDLPDIKPVLYRNEEGIIEVTWLAFRDNQYKQLYAAYNSQGWSKEQVVEEEEQETPEEVETGLPSFLPANSQYVLKSY